ncbi:MAG: GNAT family N-acetyltransferase [Chitinophagaceae bacterium]|nr:GNAT family N-acetyltransferase [Chitinophagaceae bacterium]
MTVTNNNFLISTDKDELDIQFIHRYLSTHSYWAKNIPLHTVQKSIAGSCCFGLYVQDKKNISGEEHKPENGKLAFGNKQIGFARVVTDYASFAYLADVFIIEAFRGKGLSKWLMEEIMAHPDLQGLRRWMLATKDAHGLYAKFGFAVLDKPERIMGYKPFEEYPPTNS